MLNGLTIDLEDWFQGLTSTSPCIDLWPGYESRVARNTEKLLRLLSQHGVKATFFVLGYIAEHMPELVHKVADDGHEIALHGYYHQKVDRQTPDQFRDDIVQGLEAVQRASGQKILGYRAPMFSIDVSSAWALKELSDLGFEYDSSIYPINNHYYGFPGAPRIPYRPLEDRRFVEFPVATLRFLGINWPIGGGFYCRALPYALMRAGIRKLNRQGQPAVIYVHPWEFDVDQQYRQVTPRERITHYHGRAGLERKFNRLLQEFRFGPLSDLLNVLNQGCVI
jgi:polysaccharide deacetylase family protein (PEP-CTERM system associated)